MPKTIEKAPNTQTSKKNIKAPLVVALVYDQLCTFEYGIAAEVFGLSRPELKHPLYRFSSVALEKQPLHAAGGLTFRASGSLSDLDRAHTLVIPGWRGKNEAVPKLLIQAIQQAHERGTRILSICSGGYVLAAAGVLDNRRATTHWRYAEDLKSRYPQIRVDENALYIEDGNIITSAGSSAGIDACLDIIRSDYGTVVANTVARRLVMHSHRQGSQAQFIEQPVPKPGESQRLTNLIDEVRTTLSQQHSLNSMAKAVDMSSRTFQRQFVNFTGTPAVQWLTQERVARACQLLETTELAVDHVCGEVGFNNAESMRYHFRQKIEISPAEYRKRFKRNNVK
ncbi:UNVERIFIED_CONTAM: hypothetical protein GTU68_058821 [Idotea baltica]|nr:hypothetical protein [Idotea baltica]